MCSKRISVARATLATQPFPSTLFAAASILVCLCCSCLFQGSPFSGHPLSQGILQDQLVPSQAPRGFIPSFVHWVPKPKPILQVSFSPTSPAHIAADAPVGVSEVPPPQPAIAMPCSALQVLPVGLDFLLDSCWWPCNPVQHIKLHIIICHHVYRLPLCKAYPFCREHQSLLKGVGRKQLEPQELL